MSLRLPPGLPETQNVKATLTIKIEKSSQWMSNVKSVQLQFWGQDSNQYQKLQMDSKAEIMYSVVTNRDIFQRYIRDSQNSSLSGGLLRIEVEDANGDHIGVAFIKYVDEMFDKGSIKDVVVVFKRQDEFVDLLKFSMIYDEIVVNESRNLASNIGILFIFKNDVINE